MKLVKTWMEGLDEMLGGGIPDQSVILMQGEPGSGNDILAQQILYQHAAKEGKSAYFTTFMSPEILREDFEAFGWHIQPLEKNGRWIFVDVHGPRTPSIFEKGLPSLTVEGRWTLVDSLSNLFLTQKPKAVFEIVELLLNSAREHGGVHFLLLTHGMHSPRIEVAIQHMVDGVWEFTAKESAAEVDRRIRIKKMKRTTAYTSRLIPFNITDRGITIETAVRIA